MASPLSVSYLADKSFKIRSKSIPWEGYQRAGLLSAEDVALIQKVANAQNSTQADAIVAADSATYASLYIRLLGKLSRNDTLQYVAVLVGDMLLEHDDRAKLFLTNTEDLWSPLTKLLDSSDPFLRLQTSAITSVLLSLDNSPPKNLIEKLLALLASLLDQDEDAQSIALACLSTLLAKQEIRKIAWEVDESGVIAGLAKILTSTSPSPSSQTLYTTIFNLWLLSFDAAIAAGINPKHHLLPPLVSLLSSTPKEKITRVTLSFFTNLVTLAPNENLPSMLVAKLLPLVTSLKGRAWSDEEIKEDLESLEEKLKGAFEGLTTYDEYTSELESGELSWTPTHKNDEFWRLNADKLNEKDRKWLKVLLSHLLNPQSPSLTLAVATNDVAQYLKFATPGLGKKYLEEYPGARARIMELMQNENAEVKYNALIAVQRLVGMSGW